MGGDVAIGIAHGGCLFEIGDGGFATIVGDRFDSKLVEHFLAQRPDILAG